MPKDFWSWHARKTSLEKRSDQPEFKEREVWWCSLGANVGHEQDGKGNTFSRPVLIFKKFNRETALILPLTTKQHSGKFYTQVHVSHQISRQANLSQIRLIDSKRLLNKIGTIEESQFSNIRKTVIELLTQ